MARHLYIASQDRWRDYERGTLKIEAALTFQIDTCRFQVRGEKPTEGEEVIIEDDVLGRLFAGIIVKVELAKVQPDKSNRLWQVDCDDYTNLLDRRLVVEVYENVYANDVFIDLVTKYCPEFSTGGVRSGAPVVEKIVFDYAPVSECFKELCDYVGWHWMVDYYKGLQFFSAEDLATPAPLALIPGGRFRRLKHTIDTAGLRNRVYVRGGSMLSDPWTHEVVADGKARAWLLPHKPHELTLTVSENPMTVGIENVHKEADYDYLMNYQEKYVRCSAPTTTTPVVGATLAFTYRYNIPVITMVEDLESQQAIAAVQGGDGVYEHVLVDDTLVTVNAAEAAGMADLREHANPKVTGSFETEVNGWKPGQIVSISLPDRGVEGAFLVQRVIITPATSQRWTYRIEYGGRLLGIADFLRALVSAQQKKPLAETALLQKYAYGQDETAIADEIEATTVDLPMVVEESKEVDFIPGENPSIYPSQTFEDDDKTDWPAETSISTARAKSGSKSLLYPSTISGSYTNSAAGGIATFDFWVYLPAGLNRRSYISNGVLRYNNGQLESYDGTGYIAFAEYIENAWNHIKITNAPPGHKNYDIEVNGTGYRPEARYDTGYPMTSLGFSLEGLDVWIDDFKHYDQGQVEFFTIGSRLNVTRANPSDPWPYPEISTSEDGETWTEWQPIEPLKNKGIPVPYPGFVRLRALGKVKAYNYKRPFDETLVVCGVVEVG